MDVRPIGMFDSGVGGLTVLHECLVSMPHEDFVYLGDHARLPYGPRGREEVRRFAHEIGLYLEQLGVKIVVVACNTATAAALPDLQESLAVPVVGVVTGFLSAELVAAYLLVASQFRAHVNELFAAQSIEDYKGFLRLRIDPDGSLTVYPIGIERRVRHWLPAGNSGGPRQVPAQGERLDPMLLEPPVQLR